MKFWLFVLLISVFNAAFASLAELKLHITNKQYDKAIQMGEALKQQNPNSASVLFYTALAYQNNKQLKLAKTYYLKALQLKPQLAEIYNNLAAIYVAEKNYSKAAESLTSAINSQASIATAYANLGRIYGYLASQAYQQVLADDARSKRFKTTVKTQLLTSLDFNEPVFNEQTSTIKVKNEAPKIVVAGIVKKPALIIKPSKSEPKQQKAVLPSAKNAIINWAKAWKTKQYDAYINSYSNNYAPKNLNRKQWLSQSKKRIKRPGKITVAVANFDIKISRKKAYVNFDQAYRSAIYQDKVRKRMHLGLINGQWRITSETTLSVLGIHQ